MDRTQPRPLPKSRRRPYLYAHYVSQLFTDTAAYDEGSMTYLTVKPRAQIRWEELYNQQHVAVSR